MTNLQRPAQAPQEQAHPPPQPDGVESAATALAGTPRDRTAIRGSARRVSLLPHAAQAGVSADISAMLARTSLRASQATQTNS